jgi:hypothetical protein
MFLKLSFRRFEARAVNRATGGNGGLCGVTTEKNEYLTIDTILAFNEARFSVASRVWAEKLLVPGGLLINSF